MNAQIYAELTLANENVGHLQKENEDLRKELNELHNKMY